MIAPGCDPGRDGDRPARCNAAHAAAGGRRVYPRNGSRRCRPAAPDRRARRPRAIRPSRIGEARHRQQSPVDDHDGSRRPVHRARLDAAAIRAEDDGLPGHLAGARQVARFPANPAPASMRKTTSGCSTATRASKSPARAAAKNASTTCALPSKRTWHPVRRVRLSSPLPAHVGGRVPRAAVPTRACDRASGRSGRRAPRTCRAGRTPPARRGRARQGRQASPPPPSRQARLRARGRPGGSTAIVGSATCVSSSSSGLSARCRRDRSTFRQMRVTTVVSQRSEFVDPLDATLGARRRAPAGSTPPEPRRRPRLDPRIRVAMASSRRPRSRSKRVRELLVSMAVTSSRCRGSYQV